MKKYMPTNDYIFKKIFGEKGNEYITKDFLKDIIGIEIENLVIENTEMLNKNTIAKKLIGEHVVLLFQFQI